MRGFVYTLMRWEYIVLCSLSYERCLKVVANRISLSWKNFLQALCVAFVLNCIFDSPAYIFLSIQSNGRCHYVGTTFLWLSNIWRIADSVVNFVFLLLLTSTNSCIVVKMLRYYFKRKQMMSFSGAANVKLPSSTTGILIINVTSFMLCSLPAKIYYNIFQRSTPTYVKKNSAEFYNFRLLWSFLLLLQCLNSVINFYVNLVFSKRFFEHTKFSVCSVCKRICPRKNLGG